ncbi:hypothetical protein SteCoe_33600 [Stentor coeruleus]|uniref:ABC transporter domain-containing protein n=1 Tax=Stentor coeruleus TaxID=5963 RepID=A0A1R2AWJ4_9CILI|nr:hypothetical protein SteCoe_33600 [Stentor coeruleus]
MNYLSISHDPHILPTSITDIDKYSKEIVRSGACLTWHDLSVTSIKDKVPKKILKKCNGISYSSEILAVMGSSGSGKTSLVTLIADQFMSHDHLVFTGSVYLNDVHLDRSYFSEYVKFVNQHDILMPTLTAREAMTFSALLQCCGTEDEISEYVSKIIEELHIDGFADKIIGDTMIRGLSGGEKKLVSIANELISQPSVLVLDEPTSGLDSFNALRVMKVLKQQASLGKNIILTIHQPSSTIFDMLDRLLLISKGRIVYQGSTSDSFRYFANLDFVCPTSVNPSDYFDKICHVKNFFCLTDEERSRLNILKKEFSISQLPKIENEIARQFSDAKGLDRRIIKPTNNRKISVLMRRSFLNSKRHPILFTLRIIQAISIATLNAIIFNNIGYNQISVQNRNGLLFFNLDAVCLLSTQVQLLALQSERALYTKEIKQNYFGITQYFMSKLIAELPVQILFTFLFCLIQYFAIPLNNENSSKFMIFFSTALLAHMTGAALGYFSGGVANSSEEALILGGAVGIPLMMFAGYFSNVDSVFKGFSWLKYFSPFNYAFEALALNEYEKLKLDDNVIDPIMQLNIKGSISSNIAALLALECLYVGITLITLKIKEKMKIKKQALR